MFTSPERWTMRRTTVCILLLLSSLGSGSVLANTDCGRPGDTPGRFGPFDYRDPTKDQERWLVEQAHFTLYMEEMALFGFSQRGQELQEEAAGWSLVAGNLDYTLYAFPNHARALYAMAVWQLRLGKEHPQDLHSQIAKTRLLTAECYFQRAIVYAPDDPLVYHAYGAYLQKSGDLHKAAAQYEKAIDLMPDAPEPHYNLGLLYLQLNDYKKASEQADRAYALGYPLQGLKKKLAAAQQRAAN
jgi:tetratricopeptide (TPR) repeat protein